MRRLRSSRLTSRDEIGICGDGFFESQVICDVLQNTLRWGDPHINMGLS